MEVLTMGRCIMEEKYHRNRVSCRLTVCGSGRKIEISDGSTAAEEVFSDADEAELVYLSACGLELLPDCLHALCLHIRREMSENREDEIVN